MLLIFATTSYFIVLDWDGNGLLDFDCKFDCVLASKLETTLLFVMYEGEC